VDNTEKSPVILSLCTGMRGIERGIESVIGPVSVAAYVEIEAFIIENLVCEMEQGLLDPAPVWTDAKSFPAELFRGKIHGIIGGYPCQPFSLAGKLGGTNDPRHLWPFIRKHVETIGPEWCFFENVANHLNVGYRQVRQDLEDMGYHVAEGIYSAQEVGAQHRRERLFILAMANYSGERKRRVSECQSGQERKESVNSINAFRSNQNGANSHCSGSRENTKQGELRADMSFESPADCWNTKSSEGNEGGLNCWPKEPGPNQHEWEAPRTVEPGVGCTVNGYNFRTDLLRMYGNGVVEQTAEIAFIDLLRKHGVEI
jgi:site-specific DNA-cytosine methylase